MEGQEPIPPPPGWTPEARQPLPMQPYPYNPLAELARVIKGILWSTGFISFIMMLALSFIIVIAMTPEIQEWIVSSAMPREYIFIITPWPVLLFSMDGAQFQAWHFIMLGILVWAFARAKYDTFRNWLSERGAAIRSLIVPEKATGSLEGAAKLFMASISFSIMYFLFLTLINVEMNTPDFEKWSRPALIYGLFSASVFEELISRVLLVGIPMAVIGAARGWKNPAGKLLGGGSDLTPVTLGLIVFSSALFAFAHVGSWDLWKVPQVLVTGMALGWAFVRYGLHASILIHFSINLSSSATEIWPDSMALTALLGMAILIWMVAGGYFFLHYCIELSMKLVPKKRPAPAYRRQSGGQQAHAPPPPPSQWQHRGTVPPPPWAQDRAPSGPVPLTQPQTAEGSASGGFVCPDCGHLEASYDPGKLTCLKCGSVQYRDVAPASAPEKEQIEL